MNEQNESIPKKIKRIILGSTAISSLLICFMGVAVVCAFFYLVGLPPAINRVIQRELTDLKPKFGGSVLINDRALYTADPHVKLHIYAEGPPQEMQISEVRGGKTGKWEAFKEDVDWFLSPENGEKIITVRFRGAWWQNYYETPLDTIVLDDTPVLNRVQATDLNTLTPPIRYITIDTNHQGIYFDLVFDNHESSIFIEDIDKFENLTVPLPDQAGCLYVTDINHQPHIQQIGTGDMILPITLTEVSLQKDEVLITGCMPEPLTDTLTVSMTVRSINKANEIEYYSDQTTVTPDRPFFLLKTDYGSATVALYNGDNLLLAREKVVLGISKQRLYILDLEPNHIEDYFFYELRNRRPTPQVPNEKGD